MSPKNYFFFKPKFQFIFKSFNSTSVKIFQFIVGFLIYCLIFSAPLFAEGTNAGDILIQSLSAKAQGMAEAFASIPANEG